MIIPKLCKTAACRAFCELGPADDVSSLVIMIALTAATDMLITTKYNGDTSALFSSDADARVETRASTAAPSCLAARCGAVSPAAFWHHRIFSTTPLFHERFSSVFTALTCPALAVQCSGVSSVEFRRERKVLSVMNLW